MSIWSPTYQQSAFKRYHSDKHFSEFYLQVGGKNQLAQIWNEIASLLPYVYESSQPREHPRDPIYKISYDNLTIILR